VDYGGKTGQAVLMSVDIRQNAQTGVKELRGLSILETGGDDHETAGMIDGVVNKVAALTGACAIEVRRWVDVRMYSGDEWRCMKPLAEAYVQGQSACPAGDEETSLPGLTWNAFYRILRAHWDNKLRLLRRLAPDDRHGVKAVLWTGNPHRGRVMREVLPIITKQVFPTAQVLFEDSHQ
jgi:hypothetical protein